MRTLAPAQTFLRVRDKFFPAFVLKDQCLSTGATLLYLNLFRLAGEDGCCWPSQTLLARECKTSVRSVQGYINKLVELGYIQIEREGTHNVYRLLLSTHVQAIIQLAGVDTLSAPRSFQQTESIQRTHSPSATFPQNRIESQTSAPATNSPMLQGANSAPSDTQILQRQGANPAHYKRNTRIYKSPLSPLSAPNPTPRPVSRLAGGVSLSAAPAKIEKGKPACETRDAKSEFEALFAAWPRRQDKFQAQQAYASLTRSGQLPPLQTLLDVVARFKAEDRTWRNGFAPNLRFWLLGKRWQDEITSAMSTGTSSANGSSGAPSPLSPDIIAHAQKLYAAREKHGSAVLSDARQEETSLARAEDELFTAVDTLAKLWPDEPRQAMFPRLTQARLRGVSVLDVVKKALNWTGALPPAGEWFNMAVA